MANTKAKNQKVVGEVQKDRRNENQNITECSEKKDEQETGTSKKDEADNNKEEGMANKKATNQKINKEIDPFDDLTFGEYYLQNEHLFVPTQTSAEKKESSAARTRTKKKRQKRKGSNRIIFSGKEEVFNDDEGLILFRMNIQSLAPGLEIDTSVIDVPGILEDKTKEIDKKIDAQYDTFHEMLSIQMENDVEKMQMEDVELAFFPIIAHDHYYLIVFNLKTGKAVIIDNSESDATYEGKYKDNVEFVLYEGSTAVQWKTGLLPENDKNHRMQMDNLRSRIAAKILLHEVNIYQKKMSDYA
ncbi:peptidase C48, SUMO/sentrin/Ubl1 [Tanacetum coccineum]